MEAGAGSGLGRVLRCGDEVGAEREGSGRGTPRPGRGSRRGGMASQVSGRSRGLSGGRGCGSGQTGPDQRGRAARGGGLGAG